MRDGVTSRARSSTRSSARRLAIGFGAATLVGLYVHDEVTYERWLPNSERISQIAAGAAAVTLLVAVTAVLVHTWTMAGIRPVTALRYE